MGPPKVRPPWRQSAGKSSGERGYGHTWRKLRRYVLLRDRCCQPCLKAGRIAEATEVDHIVSKAKGGTDDTDNLQGICVKCHKAKTGREGR